MRSRLSKWVIPGILTVLVGSAAAMQFSKPTLEADLSARADEALQSANLTWANVRFDGRDAIVNGASPSRSRSDQAVELLAQLPGVRVVKQSIEQAPIVSPYPFVARIDGDDISLSGGAPDAAARLSLVEKAGLESSDLELLSGVDDRTKWLAATDFALRQLRQFEEGEVRLSDMTLSMSGRAKSRASYETVSIVLASGVPSDLEIGDVEITPPLESPFNWQAEYDGTTITVIGFVPDEQAVESFETAQPDNTKLNLDVENASGAPPNFTSNAAALISAFARVSEGAAEINDDAISFSGNPLSGEDAEALASELAALNVEIDLIPIDDDASQTNTPLVAESDIQTPELPALDELAAPPSLATQQSDDAPQDAAEIVATEPEIEVITPELPNLTALSTPPVLPVTPPAAVVPEPEEAETTSAPEIDTDVQEAASAQNGAADNATPQADIVEPLAEAVPDQPSIVTPPLPNLATLSAPPEMPVDATQQADAATAEIASLANEISSAPPPAIRVSAVNLCRAQLADFQSENSILFAPASTNFAEESAEPLSRLSAFLQECPSVEVYVEGHTDSDGPEGANLALSVARAEAVVVKLIESGVDAGRLYAVGYGESVPLVSNDTRAGKSQNRRIEFEIPDLAE